MVVRRSGYRRGDHVELTFTRDCGPGHLWFRLLWWVAGGSVFQVAFKRSKAGRGDVEVLPSETNADPASVPVHPVSFGCTAFRFHRTEHCSGHVNSKSCSPKPTGPERSGETVE